MADSGIAYYCYKHHQGCLVQGYKTPNNLTHVCYPGSSKKLLFSNCAWEDIGTFKKDNNGEYNVYFTVDKRELEWKDEWWKNNVYDYSIKLISE